MRRLILALVVLLPLSAHAQELTVFAAADETWMDYLADRKLIAVDTRKNLLSNDLVLIVPATKPTKIEIGPGFDLSAILGKNGRIATGDPAHVPVGIYAQQALTKLGVWQALAARLARTDDVRGALLLVERGEAPVGIVYSTDAAASKNVVIAGVFPADSHAPVIYPFAVTKVGDTSEARALMSFLAGRLDRLINITLPLASPGILVGAIVAYATCLGEFGAVITFAANIPGETQTLPLAIYAALQIPGGEAKAAQLSLVSLTLALIGLLASEWAGRRLNKALGR